MKRRILTGVTIYISNFAIKVLTAYETAASKSDGLEALTLGYLTVIWGINSLKESSLVLDVVGHSYEHTKSLPRNIVQRAVALEELRKLHDCGLIHGGSYLAFTK
jgi:hypothetical protein